MFGDEAKLAAERRSERVDTAHSPRVHEEEPSDATEHLRQELLELLDANMVPGVERDSRAVGKKTAGATEALSSEEGQKAKSAAEAITEDAIKNIGE